MNLQIEFTDALDDLANQLAFVSKNAALNSAKLSAAIRMIQAKDEEIAELKKKLEQKPDLKAVT